MPVRSCSVNLMENRAETRNYGGFCLPLPGEPLGNLVKIPSLDGTSGPENICVSNKFPGHC